MLGSWFARWLPGSVELRDRSVAVLGAEAQPGDAIALALAAAGARLALIEDRPGRHRLLLEEAKRRGGSGIAVSSLEEASEILRGLDIVVFTTGDPAAVALRNMEAERFEALLRDQAVAALALVQDAVSVMEDRGRGTIVAVAGGPGWTRGAGMGAHAAAQAATLRTLEALREEVAQSGIHLATVVPSGLAGWQPSAAQIADGVLTVLRLGLSGLSLPPGAQALEAMATLAPEPLSRLIGRLASPPPPLAGNAEAAPAKGRAARRAGPAPGASDPGSSGGRDEREQGGNNDAVHQAVLRAADLMRDLSSKKPS